MSKYDLMGLFEKSKPSIEKSMGETAHRKPPIEYKQEHKSKNYKIVDNGSDQTSVKSLMQAKGKIIKKVTFEVEADLLEQFYILLDKQGISKKVIGVENAIRDYIEKYS